MPHIQFWAWNHYGYTHENPWKSPVPDRKQSRMMWPRLKSRLPEHGGMMRYGSTCCITQFWITAKNNNKTYSCTTAPCIWINDRNHGPEMFSHQYSDPPARAPHLKWSAIGYFPRYLHPIPIIPVTSKLLRIPYGDGHGKPGPKDSLPSSNQTWQWTISHW